MSPLSSAHILTQTVDELSESEPYKGLFHQCKDDEPLPSAKVLYEIIELSCSTLFPGYYGNFTINSRTINYHIGVNIEKLFDLPCEQILAGLCFSTLIEGKYNVCSDSKREGAARLAAKFISKLPAMRRILATDVEAAYNGDPIAESYGEVIFCYPVIKTISNYRIAHELLELGVSLIPRIITEMAHSEMGIDTYPAAKIGTHFIVDHGTGIVIGAMSIIGNNAKLYQGVTLGVKSFPLNADGRPIKGIPRYPILEDNVIVYPNATILGRTTTGRDATIGGNIWVTENVSAGARIVQTKAKK